jgi:hypothetical protein
MLLLRYKGLMPSFFPATGFFLVRSRTSEATRQESIQARDSLVLFQ